MGHRLSKIVTRTGDDGTSGLANGERLPKHHARFAALGDVDELNSQIGLLLTHGLPPSLQAELTHCQHALFNLGGELSMPGATLVTDDEVARLDAAIEALNAKLPPLREFVLPGGSPAAAACHVARAVARRAERSLWALHAQAPLGPSSLRYLNRLSDFLFCAARTLAREAGGAEPTWIRC